MLAAALHTRFAPHFEGGGIGGMAYTESELEEINVDNEASEAGMMVPVPEEYLATQPLLYSAYTIQKGDMIGVIAENFGLNQGTLVSINNIRNSRAIYPNEILRIPNQDGIMHTVASGETIAAIAEKYTVEQNSIITANELFSDKVNNGTRLFVPGAKLNFMQLQEINGDLFVWPVRGRITSRYGYRISPVSGSRMFHTGIDVSAVTGVPIRAAMSGRISTAGYNDVFGYHVVIAHHSNYRTLYGHMSAIRTRSGAYVKTGEVIGYVGNTGQSTGSHLHFTVYKNGVTINPLLLMN
ncbi:MAG: M23 family metallopeptidase [Spirochaetaceae bacterium]|nr:M23 family metallopeptidase [Spirochaetaceae bacterium]